MYNLRFLNALQTVKVPSPSTLSDVLQPRQSYVTVIVHNNNHVISIQNFMPFLFLRINNDSHFHIIIVNTVLRWEQFNRTLTLFYLKLNSIHES